MRLIDYEALEKDAAPKTFELITEGKYFKAYGYLVDALNDAPTVDAVPIKAISVWLAAYAAPPKYAIDEIAGTDPDRILTVDTLVKAWEYHWKYLMECGLIGEGLDADRP